MAFTIPKTSGNLKTQSDLAPDDARGVLLGLAAHVAGKGGVLKLMHTTKAGRDMTFERKGCWQFFERRHSKMKTTSDYVTRLLRTAYADEAEKVGAGDQFERAMADFQLYLAIHDDRIETSSLRQFVRTMEDIVTIPEPRPVGASSSRDSSQVLIENHLTRKLLLRPTAKVGEGNEGKVVVYKNPADRSNLLAVKFLRKPRSMALSGGWVARTGDAVAARFKDERYLITPQTYFVEISINGGRQVFEVPVASLKKFVKTHQDASPKCLAIVMPAFSGNNLADLRGAGLFPTHSPRMRVVARQIYEALSDLRRKRIVWHDLKLRNVLYDFSSNQIRIIDYGMMVKLARKETSGKPQSTDFRFGTRGLRAPTVLQAKSHGPEVDMYSYAVILLTLAAPRLQVVLDEMVGDLEKTDASVEIPPMETFLEALMEKGQSHADPEVRKAVAALQKQFAADPEFENLVQNAFLAARPGPEGETAMARIQDSAYFLQEP